MTIIDELLILLDDLGESSTEIIPTYFENPDLQVIYSALGRLVNKGLVIKKERRSELTYSISLHGIEKLNQTLDAIKKTSPETWNRQWHLVIFDIPESKRKLRDNLRNFLKTANYGMLKSSVWVSARQNKQELQRYSRRQGIDNYIFQLVTTADDSTYQLSLFVRQCWDWVTIERRYEMFISQGERTLSSVKRRSRPQNQFLAKKAVFLYAEAVSIDPKLPINIAPHSRLTRKAKELYINLRPYCISSAQ